MIRLLPGLSETLVAVLDADEVMRRMARSTTGKRLMQNQVTDKKIVFTGTVGEGAFSISRKITRPNSFIPLVLGRVESASLGSIIFMEFKLFPGTRAYLLFWLSFVIAAGLVASRQYGNLLPLLFAVFLDVVVLWIAWANFRIQARLTQKSIEDMLTP